MRPAESHVGTATQQPTLALREYAARTLPAIRIDVIHAHWQLQQASLQWQCTLFI